jgi:hypothetical protein
MPVQLSADVKFAVNLPTSREMQDQMLIAMRKSVATVLTRARTNLSGRFLRRRSGRGLESVRTRIRSTPNEITGTVGSPLFYLRILHTGFPAQRLVTQKTGFRFIVEGGEVVRAKSIQHPGVSARPWLLTALMESDDDILRAFAVVPAAAAAAAPPLRGGTDARTP